MVDSTDLFKSIKKSLRVSFDGFDDEIKDLIQKGRSSLVSKTGPLPFEEPIETDLGNNARSLLELYCKYSWNNNLHLFWKDIREELIALQIQAASERMRLNE